MTSQGGAAGTGPQKEPAKKADQEKEEVKKGSALEDELNASSDRIRETAKWLVATFGAVAGALIVGLELSDIGQLEGADRVLATVAAFGALVATILIIAFATVVLARPRVPQAELSSQGGRKYKRLRKALNRNRTLRAGYPSISALVDKDEAEWDKQAQSWAVKNDPSAAAEERATAVREFRETKKVLPELNKVVDHLLAHARAEDIRLTFEWVRNTIIVLAVIVALGGITFAFVDNAPDEEDTPALAQRPVAARLHLSPAGRDKVREELGPGCNLTKVPVEVLSSSEDGWEVVSIPAEGCSTARLNLETEDGELEALESVSLTLPEENEGLDQPTG